MLQRPSIYTGFSLRTTPNERDRHGKLGINHNPADLHNKRVREKQLCGGVADSNQADV